jgi:hypothetical protein
MKQLIPALLLALLFSDAAAQSSRTSRTKRKVRHVDSVNSWQLKPDSVRQYDRKDTLTMPRTRKP